MGKLILNNKSYTGSQELSELSDVAISSPQNDEVLAYNSTSHKWENKTGGGGGAIDLDDLSDVNITSPTNGQALVYDSANSEWVNGDVSGGGGTVQTFEVTVSRPNNPTAISVEIEASNGSLVYDEDIPCTVYGAFNQMTDTFTYQGGQYTVTMQGFQANRDATMFTISINDTTYNVVCRNNNSSYAQTDTFVITAPAPITASDIVYDNTTSGLTATDVQDAIDEIAQAQQMVALTQAEYDALVIAGTVDPDVFYFITDATSPVYSETVLFNTVDLFNIGTTIILPEDVDRFDEIRIFTNQADSTGASETYYTHSSFATITKEQALWSISERAKTGTYRGRLDVEGSTLAGYTMTWQVEFTDKRTIKCLDKMTSGWQAGICYVSKVIGVSYGSSFIREIIGTLIAGQADITILSELITTSSTIEVFTDVFGVNPTNMVTTTGQVMITFPVQANDVGVKVRIS